MADLTGKKIANTYKDLLQVNSSASNDGVDETLRRIQDGSGKNSAISLSQNEAKIHGDLTVTGNVSVNSINLNGLDVSALNAVDVSATRINATSITTDKLDATTLVFQDVSVSSLRTGDLTAGTGTFTGAVSATAFYGDGSNLTGIIANTTAVDANTSAIASVNTRINSLSVTMASSISNHMPLIGGTFLGQVTFDGGETNFGISNGIPRLFISGNTSTLGSTGTLIQGKSGTLHIKNDGNIKLSPKAGEVGIVIADNSAVDLYYNNSKKLATTSTGIHVSGAVSVSGQVHTTNGFKVSSSYPYVNFSETDTSALNSSLISNDGKFKIGTASDTFGNFNSRFEIDHQTGNAFFSGNVTATSFYGDGSNLTGIVIPTTAIDANTSAITSINAVLSAAQTSITANASAIASVNTRIAAVSADAMPKSGGTFTGQIQTNSNVSAKFYGPVDFNAYGIVVSSNASAVFNGPTRMNSDIVLGNSSSDTISGSGRWNTDIIPTTAVGRALGTDSLRWDNAYINTFRGGINAIGTSVTDLIYPSAYGNAPANVNYVTSAVAAKASVGTSATLETRIAGVSALTSVNAAAIAVNASAIVVNTSAITSINNVVSALNSVVTEVNASAITANAQAIALANTSIAANASTVAINLQAISSVNTIAVNNVSAIASVNTIAVAAMPKAGGTFTGDVTFNNDVTMGGHTQIGNQSTDNIQVSGRFSTDLHPNANNALDLGSDSLRFAEIHGTTIFQAGVTVANTSVVTDLSATLEGRIADVSALTSVNSAAITSINNVVSALNSVVADVNASAIAANTSAIVVNTSAIASVNTIATDAMPKSGGAFTGQVITNGNVSAKFYGPVDFNNYGILVSSNASAVFKGRASFQGANGQSAIQLGNSSTQYIDGVARWKRGLIPTSTATYDFGNDSLRWNRAYITEFIGGINAALTSVSDILAGDDSSSPVNSSWVQDRLATKASVGTSATLQTNITANVSAIASVNTVLSAIQTSITANASAIVVNTSAITSINTRINAVSVTMASSIDNQMPKAGGTFLGQVTFDGGETNFGISNGIPRLFISGNTSTLGSTGTLIQGKSGTLHIKNDGNIKLSPKAGEVGIVITTNSAVDLYYNNSKKLATTSTGIHVSGAVSATSFYGDGSNLTGITAGASAGTSATLETRIAGVSALTSVNAINIAAVSALTSVNAAAITSINTVLSAAQTSITANASAIASVNTIATDAMPKAGGTFSGAVTFNNQGFTVSSTASAVFNGPARFYSAITLGNSSSDLIYTNGRFAGDLIPTTAVGRDLGTDSLRWDNAYINTLRGGINAIGTSVTDLTYPSAYGNAPANVNYVTSAVATKASVGTSVTLETRIAGVSALTSVNAINIAAVSALTSVNAAAITSINNVVSALNSVVAEVNTSAIAANAQAIAVANTSIAANASTVAINLAAITSVNNLAVGNTSSIATLSATMATSINNRTAAITSVNTRINAVSAIAVDALPKSGGLITGDVRFNPTEKAIFQRYEVTAGSSANAFYEGLQIYSSGTRNFITASATGHEIDIKATSNSFIRAGNNTLQVTPTQIYLGGTVIFDAADIGGNVEFSDNSKAVFGTGSDLQIYSDGNNGIINEVSPTGSLLLQGSHTRIKTANGSETMAEFLENGAVTLYHDNAAKLATTSTGIAVTGVVSATGDIVSGGNISGVTKSFDIEHPTKEGMRLHHGVLEGPEHAVYIRGKSSSSVIELPDYWEGLVYEDTITVQLTPVGVYDKLYVEEIKDNKVTVYNNSEYFYFIMGERKDIERFEVEYGDS